MKLDELLKFDLQLFSEPNTDENGAENNEDAGTSTADKDKEGQEHNEDKTFTQTELDEIVKTRLARERKSIEKEISEKIENEKKEAERLSKLSADEKAKELAEKKDKELADALAKIQKMELEQDTIARLTEEELPLSFKDFLMKEDAETTNEAIKNFKKEFNAAIQVEVEKRFKGKTPKTGQANANSGDVWSRLGEKYKK